MNFSFQTASEIHFGESVSRKLPDLFGERYRSVFVLTGSDSKRHAKTIGSLTQNGYEVFVYPVCKEPTVETVDQATKALRDSRADVVVAIGGGSVLDTGKAIAALANNEGAVSDYLEGIGKGLPLNAPSLPFAALPTTAGTGSEVTKNSVIGVPDAGIKVSLRSASMLPKWAIVDPELTYNLPSQITAYTGMDALIQCLEAYLSKNATPLTDGIAREGIRLAARSIRAACGEELDMVAKAELCAASLNSGIALANAKLGAVHGFAGPLGGMIEAPHGAICASLLVPCLTANLRAISSRDKENPAKAKLDDVAALVTENPQAKASYAIAWFSSLVSELPIKRLGKLGLDASQIEAAAKKSATSSSMQGNPITLTKYELIEILEEAI